MLAFLRVHPAASVVLILLMGLLSGYGVLQYADVRASYPPALTGRALLEPEMPAQNFFHLLADADYRVEAADGVLEDHRDSLAAHLAHPQHHSGAIRRAHHSAIHPAISHAHSEGDIAMPESRTPCRTRCSRCRLRAGSH